MDKIKTLLILLEVVVGFGWLIYFWLISLLISPLFVAQLINDNNWVAGMALLAIMLGGAGVLGMLQLTVKVISPEARVLPAKWLLVLIGLGFIALLMEAFLLSEFGQARLILLFPALVVMHFVYLARGYLWLCD